MSALDPWRQELRGMIPRGFLRRDQGDGLFVSDYPRHGEEEAVSGFLQDQGFSVSIRDFLAYIDAPPEYMRQKSMEITPRGCLSRSVAGIRGETLIINLPGSPKAATENLSAVIDAVGHGLEMLKGEHDG